MTTQEDAELVRRGYDAFIAGDMEWMNQHLHDQIVWHVPGNSVLAGDYRGREAVLAFFAKSVEIALPEFDIHDIAATEDHVIALLNITWRKVDGDETGESRTVQVFHLDNGRAIEAWTLNEDQAAVDAFLGTSA